MLVVMDTEVVAARNIFRRGQVFEQLGVVEKILGSHTPTNDIA